MNRITNDGTLALGPATLLRELTLRGFFRRAELDALSANFRQLSMLNPSNREVLATLGELKQIRSGAM
jgi:hypothetical protein